MKRILATMVLGLMVLSGGVYQAIAEPIFKAPVFNAMSQAHASPNKHVYNDGSSPWAIGMVDTNGTYALTYPNNWRYHVERVWLGPNSCIQVFELDITGTQWIYRKRVTASAVNGVWWNTGTEYPGMYLIKGRSLAWGAYGWYCP